MSAKVYAAAHRPAAPLREIFASLGAFFKAMVQGMQIARMVRVLNEMSDADLDRIGVKRADIPAYARALVMDEGLDPR
ncbi:MAG: hypothetical protein ACK4WC_05010 [Rubrimonas sp.]